MSFTLTGYQADAVDECVTELRDAQHASAQRGKKTAVGLSAPTGAGKTVIATAVLERLLFGDAQVGPNRELTVLWVTDDPALNRQTLNKMLQAGQHLADGDFVEIDQSFKAKRLEPGKVHFAHIHLFARGTTSMHGGGDDREFGLWNVAANTVEAYGANFVLVIDEAHRGTDVRRTRGQESNETIISRLSHGGTADHFSAIAQPPAPVIFGISATPDRFRESMNRAGRSLEDVTVPVAEVRESGLLKDRIIVRYPEEAQPTEATLLATAVNTLREVDGSWRAHSEVTGKPPVDPLLVLQVKPGVQPSDLVPIISAIEAEWGVLRGDAIAHAFESHATLHLPGGREVRYLAPDRIQWDKTCRVVLFKNALTTGWDCPRAEVMLSLRSARDFTNIAQLIGRMVRTPLAERIDTDESLNWVTLYLPHYRKEEVAKVIAALTQDTQGDIDVFVEPVNCSRRADAPREAFTLLGSLPSYARKKSPWKTETERLLALGRLLRTHNLVRDANKQARARLVGAMRTEAAAYSDELERLTQDVQTTLQGETVWDARHGVFIEPDSAEPISTPTKLGDIDAQFASAVRAMPDAVAKWWWDALCDELLPNGEYRDTADAKSIVAAIAKTPEMVTAFRTAVEDAAADQIERWRTRFASETTRLDKIARVEFEQAWNPATGSIVVEVEVPESVSAPTERITGSGEHATTVKIPDYKAHLYVAPEGHKIATPGRFPAVLTGWEKDVLERELEYGSLVGWYRNPARSKHGLGVPYRERAVADAETGLMYPDFLFFHESDGEVVVDVVDPHRHNEADTGYKWAGLARWAGDNADKVRRVVAVIKIGDSLKALHLTNDGIADMLDACRTKQDVEALFSHQGGDY